MTYSHAYTIGFELSSNHADGSDVTQDMLIAALMRRIGDLVANGEVHEAVGPPFDSAEAD